jgi:hypothetical protein
VHFPCPLWALFRCFAKDTSAIGSHNKEANSNCASSTNIPSTEVIMACRLAIAASREPCLHISVVSAFCVEHRQQETFASVKKAKPQKIATDERPNTVDNP